MAEELQKLSRGLYRSKIYFTAPAANSIMLVELHAILNGINIGFAAHQVWPELVGMTKDAIKNAVKNKLIQSWEAHRREGKELVNDNLQCALRGSYLKSVSAVATDCQIRHSMDKLSDVAQWADGIRHGVDAELSAMRKPGYSVPRTAMQAKLAAVLQTSPESSSVRDLQAALLEELRFEFDVSERLEPPRGTVFMKQLYEKLAEAGLIGGNCPPQLWRMFSEGWPCGSKLGAAENIGSLAGHDGILHWPDLLSGYFADYLRQDSRARVAFQNQILSGIMVREGSIPHKALEEALSQMASTITMQFDGLRGVVEKLQQTSEETQHYVLTMRRQSGEAQTRQSAQFDALLKNSEDALDKIKQEFGGLRFEAASARTVLEDLRERDKRNQFLLTRLLEAIGAQQSFKGKIEISAQEEPILEGYLEWVVREFRYLPNGLRLNRELIQLPLDRVYVSVRGLPASVTELQQGEQKSWAGTSSAARERDQRKYFSTDAPTSVHLARALNDSPCMVILGDPGSGKTTLSRWLALNFARAMLTRQADEVTVSLSAVDSNAESDGDRVSLGKTRLPIFLRVADLAAEMKNNQGKQLVDLLASGKFKSRPTYPEGHQLAGKQIERESLNQLFQHYLSNQRALVLLDGLDEVGSVTERRAVVDRIQAFLEESYDGSRGNYLVVTSREVGYGASPLQNSVARYTIESMDAGAVHSFSKAWHNGWSEAFVNLTPKQRNEEAARVSSGLLDQIFADDALSLRQISSNPLMLSLLCALNLEGGESLPASRTALYSSLVRRELQESWAGRHPGRERFQSIVTRLLSFLAESIHQTSASGMIAKDELETRTAEIVARDPAFAMVAESATELTAGIADGAGLLVERGFEQYAFRHQTIQEYLAALALINKPGSVGDRIWAHSKDSRWHEVILFALGMLAPFEGGRHLEEVCQDLMAREDSGEERSAEVALLIASAMAEIPEFPIQTAIQVMTRLLDLYAQVSIAGRQTAFCETVEDAFVRETRPSLGARSDAALGLLREYAGSGNLDQQQAVAGIAANGNIVDPALTELLAKAALQDRARGNWRVRRFLVTSLSRDLAAAPPSADVNDGICASIDPAALAVLNDPAKVRTSRLFGRNRPSVSEAVWLRDDLFPLRQCLVNNPSTLTFLRSSPDLIKVVIALQGGLPQLGLEELEQVLAAERARLSGNRADVALQGLVAAHLDCEVEPRLHWLRSVPLSVDPSVIWRGSPLSRWLAEQLESRVEGDTFVERLIQLRDQPESREADELIAEFAWNWYAKDGTDVTELVRGFLMRDVLLALTALGHESGEGTPEGELMEAVRSESQWVEVYQKEAAYRGMLLIEKWLDNAPAPDARTNPAAEEPLHSTANAVQSAFRDYCCTPETALLNEAAVALFRGFSADEFTAEDLALIRNLNKLEFIRAFAILAVPESVPWLEEERNSWAFPCLPSSEQTTFSLLALLGIKRIPASYDRMRSLAIRIFGEIGASTNQLFPLALRQTKEWDTADELFRSAMEPWLGNRPPQSDEEWKAVRTHHPTFADHSDPLLEFWVLRFVEPKGAVARRNWLTSLYEFARRIPKADWRLGAEVHIFGLCDPDETMPQWRRMVRLAEGMEDTALREPWLARLETLRPLALEREWSVASESRAAGQPLALASLSLLTGNRPLKAYAPLSVFNEDRPFALAMYWSFLLLNDSDDPVYSCAVVLDTVGKKLSASMNDLMRSLVLLETWAHLPYFQEWPIMPTPESRERRRDLLFSALMVLFRIPQTHQMVVEWFLRRLFPYLSRLDREFTPLAIAVAARLRDVQRPTLLDLLCPGCEGDSEAALGTAWDALPAIPDPYLRWRTEWVLGSVSGRRRDLPSMLSDVGELQDANERFVCLALLMIEGSEELLDSREWRRLRDTLPERHSRTLDGLLAPAARLEQQYSFNTEGQGLDTAIESALTWLRRWKEDERNEPEISAVAVADLQLRMLRLNWSDNASTSFEFWKSVSQGRFTDETLVVADPITGLRWALLRGDKVEILRKVVPAETSPSTACPPFLQFIRGANPEALPYLHWLVNGRDDLWGDWAALMLAETGNWTKQVVERVRNLLRSLNAVFRNRALFAFGRGGDLIASETGTNLLYLAKIGPQVVEEMAATLKNSGTFHPVVDMTMIFALDRVVFDDSRQMRAWLAQAANSGPTQKIACAVIEHMSRASLVVCRLVAEHLSSPLPALRESLIRSVIYLWTRENWRTDDNLWSGIRRTLLEIGRSDDESNATKALEALGYIGIGVHGEELIALAFSNSRRTPAILRTFGIAAEEGYKLTAGESAFVSEALSSSTYAAAVAAAEAGLRAGMPIEYLEQLVDREMMVSALIASLEGYFVGESLTRKVHEAGVWLEQLTHAERLAGIPLESTTFSGLLRRIYSCIVKQSLVTHRSYPVHERLPNMLAVATAAAELMPDSCESLLNSLKPSLADELKKVVLRHASYVARQAALVLLSLTRKFSEGFAKALESALADLSMLQTTAVECVGRIEDIDEKGLDQLNKLITNEDALVAFSAARVVQKIAVSSTLTPSIRSKFLDSTTASLRTALRSSGGIPRVAFVIESSLAKWAYRPSFLGLVREMQEDALFSMRQATPIRRRKAKETLSERVELFIAGTRGNETVEQTLTLGPNTAKSKHPAMHQSAWRSGAFGESTPPEIMDALEKVQKLSLELGVSYAKTLHTATHYATPQQKH